MALILPEYPPEPLLLPSLSMEADVAWCATKLAKTMGGKGKTAVLDDGLRDIARHLVTMTSEQDVVDFLGTPLSVNPT